MKRVGCLWGPVSFPRPPRPYIQERDWSLFTLLLYFTAWKVNSGTWWPTPEIPGVERKHQDCKAPGLPSESLLPKGGGGGERRKEKRGKISSQRLCNAVRSFGTKYLLADNLHPCFSSEERKVNRKKTKKCELM